MTIGYVIIDGDPTPDQWSKAIEDSSTARKSLDESKVLLKFCTLAQGGIPDEFSGMAIYNQDSILVVLGGEGWSE